MAREFAESTVGRLEERLAEERVRLEMIIARLAEDRENAKISETPADHGADPESMDGGSLAFELEKDLSLEKNAVDLLDKVARAEARLASGEYGSCEVCGKHIPLARLEALPYVTTCVDCAARR
jgi:RNA polymerase-binding transcription factor DksA